MENVEFRLSPDGLIYYQEKGKEERKLTKFSNEIIEPMTDLIARSFPQCFTELALMYGRSKEGKPHQSLNHATKVKIVERFVRCNFGEHDLLTYDIEHDIVHFEEVKCPLRGGYCKHEGIICKPKSLIHLSPAQREIADLYIEGLTFDEIAHAIGKNEATVKCHLRNIKESLGVKNCRDIIRVLRTKNY